jgi:hypothetical protein
MPAIALRAWLFPTRNLGALGINLQYGIVLQPHPEPNKVP